MCDFSPVRNWAIVFLGAFVLAAVSIAVAFGLTSSFPWVASICFWAAASWAGIALISAVAGLLPAVRTFCLCLAARGPSCLQSCDRLIKAVGGMVIGVIAVGAFSVWFALMPLDTIKIAGLLVSLAATFIAAFACLAFTISLSACGSNQPTGSSGGPLTSPPTNPTNTTTPTSSTGLQTTKPR